jgi:hypothetical protein
MTNEDLKVQSGASLKRYIITFKPKDQRADKKTDKVEIVKKIKRIIF